MNIVLLGPPGCGKGTQSKKICETMNLFHFSTGDILRNEVKEKTEIGLKIESIINAGHGLLNLASRLPSYIELRKISLEYKNFNKAILIADEIGYLCRENADRYEGNINFNSRRECKNLLDAFQEMWETALPDKNLRKIYL